MFEVNFEQLYKSEEGIVYRLSWYDGKEHHEKIITRSREELEDE